MAENPKVKTQKYLELKLDKTLNFREHLKDKLAIVNKEIEMLKKLSYYLPCYSLVTLYKEFIRPHLDYSDISYDNQGIWKYVTKSKVFNTMLL